MSHEEQTHTSALWAEHTQEAEPDSNWQLEACTLEAAEGNVLTLPISKHHAFKSLP